MNRWLIPRELLGYEAEGKNWPASQREVHPTTVTYSSKPSSGERCEKTAGERVGAKEGTTRDHSARQSRSLRAFSEVPTGRKSVGR